MSLWESKFPLTLEGAYTVQLIIRAIVSKPINYLPVHIITMLLLNMTRSL